MTWKVLDLFCGAGGAAVGLKRAWPDAEIIGVDNRMQKHYPFTFVLADALKPPFDLREFDFIWASPPCQRYTLAQNAAKRAHLHPDLIPQTRQLLEKAGAPYVIENVVGAPLAYSAMLCGLSLGTRVRRHRLFESNSLLMAPPCQCKKEDYYVVFGHECRNRRHGEKAGRKNRIAQGQAAMGIDWMTRGELSEAIPPAYSEFIARQIRATALPTAQPAAGQRTGDATLRYFKLLEGQAVRDGKR